MHTDLKKFLEKSKSKVEISQEEYEQALIATYRLLDSELEPDYNICLSVICHIANSNITDLMIQQLLHDCITKSRVFLYDQLLEKLNPDYNPHNSAQDSFLRAIYTSGKTNTTLTKPQKEVFDTFQKERRLIVSAPTSFGKTRIVREIIAHNSYRNIVLIMPTVSLLSELYQDMRASIDGYIISKSSKVEIDQSQKYILILTPERMSSFLEENPSFQIDFFVMDEIYKVDHKLNDDRYKVFSDILYRLAKSNADFYLIGPYISEFSKKFRAKFNCAIKIFSTEIVQKDHYWLDNETNRGPHSIESGNIKIIGDKFKNLLRLISEESIDGKFLIYRYTKQYVEDLAKKLTNTWPVKPHNEELIDYLSQNVSEDWGLISCIKRGVAFHHGAMPRHIQDLIVEEFNKQTTDGIDYLFCTTSLTEGINSAAKNVVLYDKKIGSGSELGTLDRKNIEGRAGRFMQHFIGRVFHLETQTEPDENTHIEIEFLDKESPSIETLIQVDAADIPEEQKATTEQFKEKLDHLGIPQSLIKENKFVSIDGQINLIKHLQDIKNLEQYYFDGQFPELDVLREILSTIYDYLFTDNDKGRNFDNDVGKSILLQLTNYYIYHTPTFKELLNSDTVAWARKEKNSRIRYVFDLSSKYFEFVWPKYIKAFEKIYNFSASMRSQKTISVDMLVAQLEYGTTKPHEIILRDSGLPNEVIKKISTIFQNCLTFEDIQATKKSESDRIKKLLHPVESRVIEKYI
jgi:helicase